MKKILEYISCVLLVVVMMPFMFVFVIGGLFILVKADYDLAAAETYMEKWSNFATKVADWVIDLF